VVVVGAGFSALATLVGSSSVFLLSFFASFLLSLLSFLFLADLPLALLLLGAGILCPG
jgi:ABC-type uncharacterized transport system permease subunit